MEFAFFFFFFEKNQISDLMKIRLVAAELFHADGQTDRHDEDNSRFSQFVNVRKNGNLMRTNHYEARTLSALHEIRMEWYLLESRILAGLFVIRETGRKYLTPQKNNALREIPSSGMFQRTQSVATFICPNLI
jgi:hypothetical protein